MLGLLELSGNCLFVRMTRRQTIFGRKNVEVALTNADDQVLLCGLAISLGLGNEFVGATQPNNLVPAKDRLPQTEPPVGVRDVDLGGSD